MSLEAKFEAHYAQIYADNVKMRQQQMKPLLRSTVTEIAGRSEAMAVSDLLGTVTPQEMEGRDRRNVETAGQNSRRWVTFPKEIRSGQYFDSEDQLRMIHDPTSKAVEGHLAAVNRTIDDRIMGVWQITPKTSTTPAVYEARDGGILGGAVDGKAPGGSRITLPAKCITAAGGTGLTLTKIMGAVQRLREDDFGIYDQDMLFCAISPKHVTDLLNIAAATGTALNQFDIEQLKTGKPTSLIGLNWIVTNRVLKDSSNEYLLPIWSKRNIVMAVWQDVNGDMWEDTANNKTPYARVQARVDVVRVEDDGVHVIKTT